MSKQCQRCEGRGLVCYPAAHPMDAWADQWEPCPTCSDDRERREPTNGSVDA